MAGPGLHLGLCCLTQRVGAAGTYMQGVAFRQADGKVIVETASDDSARIKGAVTFATPLPAAVPARCCYSKCCVISLHKAEKHCCKLILGPGDALHCPTISQDKLLCRQHESRRTNPRQSESARPETPEMAKNRCSVRSAINLMRRRQRTLQ